MVCFSFPSLLFTLSATTSSGYDRTPNSGFLRFAFLTGHRCGAEKRANVVVLSGVVLDDQLFVHRRVDLLAAGQLQNLRALLAVVPIEPFGRAAVSGDFEVRLEDRRFLAALPNRDHV